MAVPSARIISLTSLLGPHSPILHLTESVPQVAYAWQSKVNP